VERQACLSFLQPQIFDTVTTGQQASLQQLQPETQFTANVLNDNRLGVPAGYGARMDYDAAGNLVNDTYTSYGRTDGIPTRLYDAENRMATVKDGNLQVVSSYSYNADGQRVRRNVGGVETWQIYGIGSELLAEYASGAASFVSTKEYGYRNGELLVTVTSGDDQRMKRFLQALYYGALQVDAPAQWMADKTNELAAAGGQSQAQLLVKAKEIARNLFLQTTYDTNPWKNETEYVTHLYYAYLQRGPDTGGLNWWVGQATGSLQNRINVLNAFEASGEFLTLVNTLYGTATSDGQRTENYVTNFYQGALNRPPDFNELATNSATLNNAAAQGQSQVITAAETMGRALFAAQVNDASLSNTQYVTNLYEGFLQRAPDTGGLGWWAGQASVGQGRQNVLNAFAASSAFRELAGTLYREANWLVADHLGTPRMVVNKSGSLSGMKRHDYLPFGEELGAGTSGRTATPQGYSSDTIRQKFTSKERDTETNLDYFEARYYASTQGRFTSVDPLLASAKRMNPQTWNRYSYGLNNPLRYTDPDGEDPVDENIDQEVRRTITTTEVIVQDQDRRGNVIQQAKVTIAETKIESLDKTFDPITITTAMAENTGNGARNYSQDQLDTMANVAQNIVEVSQAKKFDPTIALGIANTETRLGTAPPGESAAHKQPNINPMQLSGTSGTTATTNLRSNIAGSIGIFNANSAPTNTLNQRLQDYNRESVKVAYANKAERQINQIRQSQKTETKLIRFSIF